MNARVIALIVAGVTLAVIIRADDEKARALAQEAFEKGQNDEWRRAANKYMDAELQADDPIIKSNALKLAARAYRRADMRYKEYQCLKKLIEDFPDQIDFAAVIHREYQIANSYLDGYRDHPYWWMPWLEDDEKTQEIYEDILNQAPYAEFAPRLMLRLAEIYTGKGEYDKADALYDKIARSYTTSSLASTAYLDKANLSMQLARNGDGDGNRARSADRALKDYLKMYPTAPEGPWAKKGILELREVTAARLYDLAVFYKREKNFEAARRYIRDILVNYPQTRVAPDAEKLLSKIDKEYKPKLEPRDKSETKYDIVKMAKDPQKPYPVSAEDSEKWLIPLTDLGFTDTNREGPMNIPFKDIGDFLSGKSSSPPKKNEKAPDLKNEIDDI